MVYHFHNVIDKLAYTPDPYYVSLFIRNRLAGTICFGKRPVHSGYAYFDPDNIRPSRLIYKFGFRKIKTFNTIIFTRLFPEDDLRVIRINKDGEGNIHQLLMNYYNSYQLVSFNNLFNVGSYFVLKIGNEIVAGIHTMNENWEIRDLTRVKRENHLKCCATSANY